MSARRRRGPRIVAAAVITGLGAGMAFASGTGAAATDATCFAMAFGPSLACCASFEWTLCAERARDPETGEPQPFRDQDFDAKTAIHVATRYHVDQGFMLGQGLCLRLNDGSLECSPVLEREHRSLMDVKGFDQGPSGAGFASAMPGTFGADGRGAPLCGLYDYDATCYVWNGKELEPRGVVRGPFHAIAVGASFACGYGKGSLIRCWDVPAEARPSKTKKLVARDFAPPFLAGETVRALSFGGDQACALLEGGRVLCFHGLSATEAVPVKLPGIAVSLARSLDGGCVVTKEAEVACFHDGPAPEAVPVANLGPLPRYHKLFVGQREACVSGPHALTCFDLAKNAAAPAPKRPEPLPAASEPPPKPAPVVVAEAPTAQAAPVPPPEVEWTSHLALPFSFGTGSYKTAHRSDRGLWLALRAQALFGPEVDQYYSRHSSDFAFGPYGELSWHPVMGKKRLSAGAGVSFAWWFSAAYALVPSIGWYQQDYGDSTQHGLQAGVFLGVLNREWGPLSLPIGLRLDGRLGLGSESERALLFGGLADGALAVAIPVAFYLLATADWSFD